MKIRYFVIIFTALLGIMITIGIWFPSIFPMRINTSPSMPYGVYGVSNTPVNKIKLGDVVSVCLPFSLARFVLNRGYLMTGSCPSGAEPVIKKVIGLGGDSASDTVQLSQIFVKINHKTWPHSATRWLDLHGRKLPSLPRGTLKIKLHQVWLYGELSPKSWDSRYYGAIPLTDIQHHLIPLITWR